jgi:hypothetical protein
MKASTLLSLVLIEKKIVVSGNIILLLSNERYCSIDPCPFSLTILPPVKVASS